MFNGLIKKEKSISPAADKVANHIIGELQSPYIYEYIGNIRYKMERKPTLSERKAAVFKKAVLDTVIDLLDFSGYAQIKGDGQLMIDLFDKHGIEFPEDRLTGDVWFVEDNQDVYFYREGMNGAKRI